jgi:hypothetical protein
MLLSKINNNFKYFNKIKIKRINLINLLTINYNKMILVYQKINLTLIILNKIIYQPRVNIIKVYNKLIIQLFCKEV